MKLKLIKSADNFAELSASWTASDSAADAAFCREVQADFFQPISPRPWEACAMATQTWSQNGQGCGETQKQQMNKQTTHEGPTGPRNSTVCPDQGVPQSTTTPGSLPEPPIDLDPRLLQALRDYRDQGVRQIAICFDGYHDTGAISGVEFTTSDGAAQPVETSEWYDLLDDYLEERVGDGWECDEGGGGEILFDLEAGAVTISTYHNQVRRVPDGSVREALLSAEQATETSIGRN